MSFPAEATKKLPAILIFIIFENILMLRQLDERLQNDEEVI